MHIQVGWQLGHPTSAETQRQDGENSRSWARTGTFTYPISPEQWNMNELTTVHVDWLVIIIGVYRGYTLIHGFTPWFIDVYCMSLWPNWEPWLFNQPAGWYDAYTRMVGSWVLISHVLENPQPALKKNGLHAENDGYSKIQTIPRFIIMYTFMLFPLK